MTDTCIRCGKPATATVKIDGAEVRYCAACASVVHWPRELRVTRIDTGEVIHRVNVEGKSDREVERIIGGMLINADTDRFFIADSADDERQA